MFLAAILLIVGLPNISQPYAKVDDLKAISEIFATNTENKIVAENGAILNCTLQSKKASMRSQQDKSVIISVNSNLICR